MIKKSGRERRGRRRKIETERGDGGTKRELTVRERKMKKEGMIVGKKVRERERTNERAEGKTRREPE